MRNVFHQGSNTRLSEGWTLSKTIVHKVRLLSFFLKTITIKTKSVTTGKKEDFSVQHVTYSAQ